MGIPRNAADCGCEELVVRVDYEMGCIGVTFMGSVNQDLYLDQLMCRPIQYIVAFLVERDWDLVGVELHPASENELQVRDLTFWRMK